MELTAQGVAGAFATTNANEWRRLLRAVDEMFALGITSRSWTPTNEIQTLPGGGGASGRMAAASLIPVIHDERRLVLPMTG